MNEEQRIYIDGSYLALKGGTWHLEDSPFKVANIMKMLKRHPEIPTGRICEVGCGAGGILAGLQRVLPKETSFVGYEISPDAHKMSLQFENSNCQFVLGDAFGDDSVYDVVLVMDVVEHVEDHFGFLRKLRQKGRYKLYHIPIETHATTVLRGKDSWDASGHLHLFTIETSLKCLKYTGHRVIDWMLTEGAFCSTANSGWRTKMSNLVRYPLSSVSPKLSARIMGGFSMLILTE